jgi:hypothetical protein
MADQNEDEDVHPADEFADVDFSPMSNEELTFLAAKMFQMYDDEEAERERQASGGASGSEPASDLD